MSEPRLIPPEDWGRLPIQPPAGLWLRRMRPFILGTIAAIAVLTIVVFLRDPPLWVLLIAAGAVTGQALIVIVIGIVAMKPYHQERQLGYTTWPASMQAMQGARRPKNR